MLEAVPDGHDRRRVHCAPREDRGKAVDPKVHGSWWMMWPKVDRRGLLAKTSTWSSRSAIGKSYVHRAVQHESLSGSLQIPRVALPTEIRWITAPVAQVSCLKRKPAGDAFPITGRRLRLQARPVRIRPECSPARGTPFAPIDASKYLSAPLRCQAACLSTAFDSVTLYGYDPDDSPRHLRQGGRTPGFQHLRPWMT